MTDNHTDANGAVLRVGDPVRRIKKGVQAKRVGYVQSLNYLKQGRMQVVYPTRSGCYWLYGNGPDFVKVVEE